MCFSAYQAAATGLLLLIFILVILYLWFNNMLHFSSYEGLTLLLLFTVAAGVHGLQCSDAMDHMMAMTK
jgi:hypothetical protein